MGTRAMAGRATRRQFLVATIGAGIVSACDLNPIARPTTAPTATALQQKAGGTARVDIATDPNNLDHLRFGATPAVRVVGRLAKNGLYRWNFDTGSIEPDLATSMPTFSTDGLTCTVKLRSGVTWHDGTPFDSRDVKYTADIALDPKNAVTLLEGVPLVKVEAPDPTTVVFTLSQPYTPFLDALADHRSSIISSRIPYVPAVTYASMAMGTGPFKLVEYTKNVRLRLERNPNYFGGAPLLDAIELMIVPQEETRIANLINGISHVMPFASTDQMATLRSRGALVDVVKKSQAGIAMLVNHGGDGPGGSAPPYTHGKSKDFRLAVAWAIDRGRIVDLVYGGAAEAHATYLSPASQYYDPKWGAVFGAKPDLAKAKDYLAKSGVDTSQPVRIVALSSPTVSQIGALVQADVEALGLKTTLNVTDLAGLAQHRANHDYVLYITDGGSRSPAANTTYPALLTNAPGNHNKWGDARFDALIRSAQRAAPGEESKRAWSAVQEYEVEILPVIQIVLYKYIEAYSKKLVNYIPSPETDLGGLAKASLQ